MKSRLITFKEAAARISLSRSEIYRRVANGTFPTPVRLGPKRVAFVEHEVEAWIAERIGGENADG
jgi:prophage regulatory protein